MIYCRIYNRALSEAEIKALYSDTQPWSIPNSTAYWGARLSSESTDTDGDKWGTDGSSDKWIAVGDGDYPVVSREAATGMGGSTQVFQLRTEVGSNKVQRDGVYKGILTVTASSL